MSAVDNLAALLTAMTFPQTLFAIVAGIVLLSMAIAVVVVLINARRIKRGLPLIFRPPDDWWNGPMT